MEEADIAETLQWLQGESVQDRAIMLGVLAEEPSGEARIRAAVEALLDDRSICVTQPPPRWLEIRQIAAEALAAERHVAGIVEPVMLRAVPVPMDVAEVSRAAEAAFGSVAARWSLRERYERLREAGRLSLADLVLRPGR
jgi:hypothetical protein